MSLAEDEIIAGQAYTVAIPVHELSVKRRGDAVALVKGIDGQREDYVYDPQNPRAFRTGYVANADPARAVSKYDGTTRTWMVTVPAAGGRALSDLRALVHAYDAEVEVAGHETAPEPARESSRRPANAEWAEYGCGFGPDELDAMSEQTRHAITGQG